MAQNQPFDSVCEQIGKQLKLARNANRMTLAQLASELGISYQQLQKYEKGINRISAEKLWRISQFLDVPIWHFFTGLNGNPEISPEYFKDAQQIIRLAQRIGSRCSHQCFSI